MEVVGVDGYPHGWVSVRTVDGRFEGAALFPDLARLLAAFSGAAVVAVDIPIGLPVLGEPRAADLAARLFLGSKRNSVFRTFAREVLEGEPYAEANRRAVALTGGGMSQQSYALRRKILEADLLAGENPRMKEVHPEVSFAALAGEPLTASKKSWSGMTLRRRLLEHAGLALPDDLGAAGTAAPDDVLDAAVAAWSAYRIATSAAQTLPENPPTDERGRVVAIFY